MSVRHKVGVFFRSNLQFFIIFLALLVGLRIALPSIVKWYVNKTLDEMPEYDGQIGDVDMKLWRGAYQIQNIEIIKTDGDVPVPFFAAENVEFSVQWAALFEGALVGEIEIFSPEINFVKGPTEETSQVGVDKPWLDVVQKLFPLDINRFEVHNGSIHYRDFHSQPKVDLMLDRIEALATNLTNSKKLSKTLVAELKAKGRSFEESNFELSCKIDPSSHRPTFDLNFDMKPLSLTKLNDFAEAYGRFDFEKGTLTIAMELACVEGNLKGYVKPILDGISTVSLQRDTDPPLKLVWDSLVGGILRVFRNQPQNRFATKIPIEGTLDNPKIPILITLGNLLKNEFIRVFEPGVEGTIDLQDAQERVSDDPKVKAKLEKEEEAEKKKEAKAIEKERARVRKAQEKAKKEEKKTSDG